MIGRKLQLALAALVTLVFSVQAEARRADDLADAKTFLAQFLSADADRAAMTKALRPSAADYQAVFKDAEFAQKLKAAHDPMWDGGAGAIAPKEGQTELLTWAATAVQLREGSGDAKEFPGGYSKVADKFHDGITVIRWKFVKPGETIGMAFDGLIRVNGQWRFFPKPWRAAE